MRGRAVSSVARFLPLGDVVFSRNHPPVNSPRHWIPVLEVTFPSRVAPQVCCVNGSLLAVGRCRIIATSSTSYVFSPLNPRTSDNSTTFKLHFPSCPVPRYLNQLSHDVNHSSSTGSQLPSFSLPSKLLLNTALSCQEEASQHPLRLPGPIPKLKANNHSHKITDPSQCVDYLPSHPTRHPRHSRPTPSFSLLSATFQTLSPISTFNQGPSQTTHRRIGPSIVGLDYYMPIL